MIMMAEMNVVVVAIVIQGCSVHVITAMPSVMDGAPTGKPVNRLAQSIPPTTSIVFSLYYRSYLRPPISKGSFAAPPRRRYNPEHLSNERAWYDMVTLRKMRDIALFGSGHRNPYYSRHSSRISIYLAVISFLGVWKYLHCLFPYQRLDTLVSSAGLCQTISKLQA